MEAVDFHEASDEERVAAHRNTHDVWSLGLALDAHVARRETAPHHRRARWFVGTVGGEVVTSLAAHPLTLCVRGKNHPAIGIASVHTPAARRGQGLAPRLIDWVEAQLRQAGVEVSLLYSDISPRYYERLGYCAGRAHEGWVDVPAAALQAAPPGGRLRAWRMDEHLPLVRRIYTAQQQRLSVSLERDAEYWDYLLRRGPEDQWFGYVRLGHAEGAADQAVGYARVGIADGVWKIRDLACADVGDEQGMFAALMAAAAAAGAGRLGGWLPLESAATGFAVEPRRMEITMLKALVPLASLGGTTVWSREMLDDLDRFAEIDHV